MKKRAKKLVLAKETVRGLDAPGLLGVVGAVYTQDGGIGCTQPAAQTWTCACNGGGSASCDYTCSWNNTAIVYGPQTRDACTAP